MNAFSQEFFGPPNFFGGFQDLLQLLRSKVEPGGAQGSQDIFGLRDFLGSQIFLGSQEFLGSFLVKNRCPKFRRVFLVPKIFLGSQDLLGF